MHLLDIAFQGVQGLPPVELKLHPRLNAIVTPPGVAEVLVRALRALLAGPDPGQPLGGGATPARGLATLVGPDGSILRLARELEGGRARLWLYARDRKTFDPLTEQPAELAQVLRDHGCATDPQAFDRAFHLAPAAGARPAAASDADAVRQRLAKVEADLAAAGGTEQLEFELDGVQKQRFALEDALNKLPDPDAEVKRAQARLASFAQVPADLAKRYQDHLGLVRRRDDDLARWQEEHDRITALAQLDKPPPLRENRFLWAGLGLGLAAVVTAIALGSRARGVALLDLPFFGLAAYVAWRHFDQLDRNSLRERRIATSELRRDRIVARDGETIAAMDRELARLGLSSPEEVDAAVAERERAAEAVRQAFADRAASSVADRRTQLLGERGKLDIRIAQLDERLMRSGAGVDVAGLRAESDALRRQLATLVGAPAAPAAPATDPVHYLPLAASLWASDPAATAPRLSELASGVLSRASGGRLRAVTLAPGVCRIDLGDGRRATPADLPPVVRALLDDALRIALVAGCDGARRRPVVVVDGADTRRLYDLAGPELCAAGQVLLLTTDAARVPPGAQVSQVAG